MTESKCARWVGLLRKEGYRADMLRSDGPSWTVRVTDEKGDSALLFDDGPEFGAGPLLFDAYEVVMEGERSTTDEVR